MLSKFTDWKMVVFTVVICLAVLAAERRNLFGIGKITGSAA